MTRSLVERLKQYSIEYGIDVKRVIKAIEIDDYAFRNYDLIVGLKSFTTPCRFYNFYKKGELKSDISKIGK